MALTLKNHSKNIMSKEPTRIDQISPGDVIQFRYKAKNASDEKPLVFVLFEKQRARGKKGKTTKVKKSGNLVGINLNYLSGFEIEKLYEEDNFMKMKGWNYYQKAFRTFKVSDIQSLKWIDFKTNQQIRKEQEQRRKDQEPPEPPPQPEKPEGGK